MLENTIQFEREAEWERAAKMLDLDPVIARELLHPQLECVSRHECSSGAPATLHLVSSEWSAGRTVAAIEVGEHVQMERVREAAQQLRLQIGLMGAGVSAAAIGVRLPSAEMSERDLWNLSRECSTVAERVLGEVRFLPSDVRGAAFATWMGARPALSPENYYGRLNAFLAVAMSEAAHCALESQGRALRGARCAVLGLTPVVAAAVLRLSESGVRIVSVADESGAVVDEKGLDVPFLLEHTRAGGLVAEFAGGEHVTHSEVIAIPADVLFLDGGDPEITTGNAHRVKASLVIEGPGSCLSDAGADGLEERGTVVLPSWLIQSARLLADIPTDLRPTNRLQTSVKQCFGEMWEEFASARERWKLPLRRTALLLALERLAERASALRP